MKSNEGAYLTIAYRIGHKNAVGMKLTQPERIMELLISKATHDAILPEIMDLKPRIANYTDKISQLRKMGIVINNSTKYFEGVSYSYYKLEV